MQLFTGQFLERVNVPKSVLITIYIYLGFLLLFALGCESKMQLETRAVECANAAAYDESSSENTVSCSGSTKDSLGLRILTEPMITNSDRALIKWDNVEKATSYTVGLFEDLTCGKEVVSFLQAESEKSIGILRDGAYYVCVYAHFSDLPDKPAENNGVKIVIDRLSPRFDTKKPLPLKVMTGDKVSVYFADANLLSYNWELSSGPGDLIFSDQNNATTAINGDVAGAYQVAVTAVDSAGNLTTLLHVFELAVVEVMASSDLDTVSDVASPTNPLGDFSILMPVDGLITNDMSPSVSWSASSGASSYSLLIGDEVGCLNSIQGYFGENGLTQILGSLPDGVYYICLQASDGGSFFKNADSEVSFEVDTIPAAVTSVSAVSGNGAFMVGNIVTIAINYSENVFVENAGGTPGLHLETGPEDRFAFYDSGSGSSTLKFIYTIESGDFSEDLNYKSALALYLQGGSIVDQGGNAAGLILPEPNSSDALASIQDIIIDTSPPAANISGEPSGTNNIEALNIVVAGTGVTEYKYKLGSDTDTDCSVVAGYSSAAAVANPISDDLSLLADGSLLLCVIGRDLAGNWQLESRATVANWTKITGIPAVSLSGQPTSENQISNLAVTVSGATITHYRYKVGLDIATDCEVVAGYSAETEVYNNIEAVLSSDGLTRLCVVGKNSAGLWQDYSAATTAVWTRDTQPPTGSASLAGGASYFIAGTAPPLTLAAAEGAVEYQLCGEEAAVQVECGGVLRSWTTYTESPLAYDFLSDGTKVIYVQFRDLAANISATASAAITIDNVLPVVSIFSSQDPGPSNADILNLTVVFSEDVSGFELSDLGVTGGVKSNFSVVDATTYRFDITSPFGEVSVNVGEYAAEDNAGNGNLAASQWSIFHDAIAPTVELTSLQDPGPTNALTLNLTAQFSEAVTDFSADDILVGNGSIVNFNAIDSESYTFDVLPTVGVVTVDISGDVAADALGNNNVAASQWSIFFSTSVLAPQNLTVSANINQLDLAWDSSGGESGYLVARSSSSVTFTPTDGNSCADQSGTQGPHEILCVTNGYTFNDSGLDPDTYYYGVFAFDGNDKYSDMLSGSGAAGADLLSEGFEAGDTAGWLMGGTGSWFAQGVEVYAGGYSGQSPDVDHDEYTCIKRTIDLTGTFNDTIISFQWKVGSEEDYDFSRFYVNNVAKSSRSGDRGWLQESHDLAGGGSYELKWCYEKDDLFSSGCDCMYLDDVKVPDPDLIIAPKNVDLSSINAGFIGSFSGNLAAEGYLVARSTSPVDFRPLGGVSYSVGSQGGVQIVKADAGNAFTDTGLVNGTTYHYTLWSYDSSYNYSGGVSLMGVAMVANVVSLNAGVADGQLDISWDIAGGTAAGYLIVRNLGSAPSFAPMNGISYSLGSITGGDVVHNSAGKSLSDSGLVNGTTYYYKAWARSDDDEYSLIPASVSGVPQACTGTIYGGACWITTAGNNACSTACSAVGMTFDGGVFGTYLTAAGGSNDCKSLLNNSGLAPGSYSSVSGGASSGEARACGYAAAGVSLVVRTSSLLDGSYAGWSGSVTQVCACN